MSAHEEDGGRQCPECGVTFDIHETLGTCDKAVGPIVQAYEEAIAQVVELLGYDLENFQGQDARNLITELVDRVSRERTRQALERAAKVAEDGPLNGWIIAPSIRKTIAAAIRGLSDGESVASEEKEE